MATSSSSSSSSSSSTTTTPPPVAILMIGMAGSGKTTLVQRIHAELRMRAVAAGAGARAAAAGAGPSSSSDSSASEGGGDGEGAAAAATTAAAAAAGAGASSASSSTTAAPTPAQVAGAPYIVNLDPAVLHLPYGASIDIRDTVNYKEVMKQYDLGPIGAIITALNLFATRFDQVVRILKGKVESGATR
jgi:GTPase SAR1 family protein